MQNLPDYERPPLNEVVCGLLFEPLAGLLVPHLGLLWEKFRNEYPTCQEATPILPVVETLDQPLSLSPDLSTVPPLPRTWFIHRDDTRVIQIQRDRFLHNWRKRPHLDEYPRFGNVFGRFEEYLTQFEDFVDSNRLGRVEPIQYELTYVNHLVQHESWKDPTDTLSLFSDFVWRDKIERFLPTPEGMHWKTAFRLPNNMGRLHMIVRNGETVPEGQRIVILELTVRGKPQASVREGMEEWFNVAHEWIVKGFADLTDMSAQQNYWRRIR